MDPFQSKSFSPGRGVVITKVSDLINPVTKQWDEDIISPIMSSVDAREILQIILQYDAFNDFVAWHYSKTGYFSVKTTYHCEWTHQIGDISSQAMLQSTPGPNSVWAILWKLKVPAKVKIFGWRVLHGLIPVKSVVANRHICSDGSCPVCNQGAEDISHLLFRCNMTRAICEKLGLSDFMLEAMNIDRSGFVCWNTYFDCMLASCLVQTSVYKKLRLQLAGIFGGCDVKSPMVRLSRLLTTVLFRFLAISSNYSKVVAKPNMVLKEKWFKPASRFVKLNVDASYHLVMMV